MAAWVIEQHDRLLSLLAMAAIAAGAILHAAGAAPAGDAVLAISVGILLASVTLHVGRALVVEHRLGVDVIALVAMAGALALGE